jgi:hypothetical protein
MVRTTSQSLSSARALLVIWNLAALTFSLTPITGSKLLTSSLYLQQLSRENRLLKRIETKHALALSKYERAKAEMSQLIQTHNEEVSALRATIKQVSMATEFCPTRKYINIFKLNKMCIYLSY